MNTAVIGLGRVGLPHALVAADSGHTVYGVDRSQIIVDELTSCKTPFYEPDLDNLLKKHLNQSFIPTTDLRKAIGRTELVIITIGTEMDDKFENTDLSNLYNLIDDIINCDLYNKTMMLRTTVPIGTTDVITNRIEKKTGYKREKEFSVVFCPERTVEGKAVVEERMLPKIIGSYGSRGFKKCEKFFRSIGGEIIRVQDVKVAELAKLIDNAYRQLNFAFACDVALLAEDLKIDGIEAIESANKSYPRNNIPYPSYGVSGYCLTKDPYILEESFENIKSLRGFGSVWFYARKSNDFLPNYVAHLLHWLTDNRELHGKLHVLVAGMTFKEDVDDVRNSHGLQIVKKINEQFDDVRITIYDPFLKENDEKNLYLRIPSPILEYVKINERFEEAIFDQDVVIFTVKHRVFCTLRGTKILKLIEGMRKPPIIIDGWNIFPELKTCEKIIYHGVGNG